MSSSADPAPVSWRPNQVDAFVRGTEDALYNLGRHVPLGDSAWTIDKTWGGKFY